MTSVRFLVSGRVQGVGFRWFVRQRASALGLAGWAANLPDGRVEVVAAGAADAMARLETALREGPAAAAVAAVERGDGPPVRGSGFEVR